MDVNPNDPKYLAALVLGLQQQRNQANDTIAHLASVNALKDEQTKQLSEENALKDEQTKQLSEENAAMRRLIDSAKQAAGVDAGQS